MNPEINEYWNKFCEVKSIDNTIPFESFSFGLGVEMGNELGELVLSGKKTATTSGYDCYMGEPIPSAGEYFLILSGENNPLCVIQITNVTVLPFKDVTKEQAILEGEGDLSLAYWRKCHFDFFTKDYKKELNRLFTEEDLVVFEKFKVVYGRVENKKE